MLRVRSTWVLVPLPLTRIVRAVHELISDLPAAVSFNVTVRLLPPLTLTVFVFASVA